MRFLPFAALLLVTTSAIAAEGAYPAGSPDCLIAFDPEKGVTAKWSGPCVDGYAHGEGHLQWYSGATPGTSYEGTMRRGLFHGAGYLKRSDNSQLEAQFVDGKVEGFGVSVNANGDRYDGNFKASKRDGKGKMTYGLGGAYEGQFRNGVYHGTGTITYAGGRRATYEFVDGSWPDQNIAPKSEKKYTLKVLGPDFAGRFDSTKMSMNVPPDLGWAKLTADHKKYVAAGYRLMDPLDEPPYPEEGVGALLRSVTEIDDRGEGTLALHVKVGPDGRARSVTTYASPNKRVNALVTQILMFAKYTPGKCAGTPCTMIYPFYLGLSEHASDSRFE